MAAQPARPCPDENLLVSLVEGRLTREELGAVEEHVDSCPRCESLLAQLGEVLVPANETRDEAPRRVRIGRYEILEEVGSGAMGIVYAAYDPELRRKVALKLLRPELGSRADRPAARARLLREARLLAGLSHPHVVSVYDVGASGDDVFIAVELVEGRSLDLWLAEDRPAWREVAAIYAQAAAGLAAAHRAGLVHRDVKPANILVGSDGRVRITDFGLAMLERRDEASGVHPTGQADTTLRTASGAVVGTPAYMAPEQYAGGRVEARSDQYAFCVALAEALTGERPSAGANLEDLEEAFARRKSGEEPPPEALVRVAVRGLRPRPADRFENMDQLRAALERAAAAGTRSRARRAVLPLLAALAIAAAAAWLRPEPATIEPALARAAAIDMPATSETPTPPEAPASAAPDAVSSTAPAAPTPATDRGAAPATPSSRADDDELVPSSLLDARRSHAIGDGAGCLRHLTAVARDRPAIAARADVQQMRAQCEMFSGQCAAGRKRLAALLSSTYQGEALERAIDVNSTVACKRPSAKGDDAAASAALEALRQEASEARAKKDVARCRELTQKLAALGKQHDLGNRPIARQVAHAASAVLTQCMVEGNDCARAKARWRREYQQHFPDVVASMDPSSLDHVFYESYPACKP